MDVQLFDPPAPPCEAQWCLQLDVHQALSRLPSPLAQVAWAVACDDYRQREIASQLGVSQTQVHRWWRQAQERLRRSLEDLW